MKQSYLITIIGTGEQFTFRAFKQSEDDMEKLVKILLGNFSVTKVEVHGVKTPDYWKEFTRAKK